MAVAALDTFVADIFEDAIFSDFTSDYVDRLDFSQKLIFIKKTVTELHPTLHLYPEVRTIRSIDESLRVFDNPVSAQGNEPAGAGFTPRRTVLNNGWRVALEYDSNTVLSVTGEMISDDGFAGAQLVNVDNLASGVSALVNYVPPDAEILVETVAIGSGVTAQDKTDIAELVWNQLLTQFSTAGTAGKKLADLANGMTTTQETKLDAVKSKTDELTFTNANQLDANVKSMNDATVNGTGQEGDLWRG